MLSDEERRSIKDLVACVPEDPYHHQPLSCKSYGTSQTCCNWHIEDIDLELDILCWQTWCIEENKKDVCWKYKSETCDNYTPLK